MRVRVLGIALGLSLLAGMAPARAGDPSTAVAVSNLGLADYSVSASVVQARVAPGYTVRPCFGGGSGSADVFVVVTRETYLSLHDVPAVPVDSVSLLTCADPPVGLARADATDPPWYRLGAWTDSAAYNAFLADRGLPAEAAAVSISGSGHDFTFSAVLGNGTVLAAGRVVTAGAPAPRLADCAQEPSRGRLIEGSTSAALDWDKTEATCLAASSVSWDAGSPVAALVGSSGTAVFSFISDVSAAQYTFRRL